nr:Brp/Blh family beta-carotene 15,15'-dioxygenase [uncultured Flavobacterium sp.]
MKKYTNFAIVASFFGLWMDSFLNTKFQVLLGFLLIFSFGILHGANDLLLIKKSSSIEYSGSTLKLLGYYVFVVLIGIVLFFILPQVALLLFIIVSAYHFGEQQWQNLQDYFPKGLITLFQLSYGLVLLLLLFAIHLHEVKEIIFGITNSLVPNQYFYLLLYSFSTVLLILISYCYWKTKKIRKQIHLELFHLLIFAIIFKSSSLIWGFAIYFILWHSIPSIIDQIRFIEGTFSMKHFRTYCKSAWLYWLISIVGIITLYSIFRETHLFNALFFSFLAAITFPHVIVITRMFLKKKTHKKPSHF